MTHVVRRQELALLDVDHGTGARGGDEQIRLPREERRNLQHVGDRRRAACDASWMSVRIGRPVRAFTSAKRLQTRLEARAAKRRPRCAVGFVERRLEDDRTPLRAAISRMRGRQLQRVRRASRSRTARQERERVAAAM